MADSKLSELTAATSVGGSDLIYLVQSNTSKRANVATVMSNAANVTLRDKIKIQGDTYQTMSSPGVIDLTKPITHLNISSATTDSEIVLPAGEQGQIKIIILTAGDAGAYWEIRSNVAGHDSGNHIVQFGQLGDSLLCLYTGSKWYMIGGTASQYP